jgi:hypothetical protein
MDTETFKKTLRCPLTTKYFKTPVTAPDGFVYEEQVLLQHYLCNTLPFTIPDENNENKNNERTLDKFKKQFPVSQITLELIDILFRFDNNAINEQYIELKTVTNDILLNICQNNKPNFELLLQYTDFNLLYEYLPKLSEKNFFFIDFLLGHCKDNNIILHCINNSLVLKRTKSLSKNLFYGELYSIIKSGNGIIVKSIFDNCSITYDDYHYPPNYAYKHYSLAELITLHCDYETIQYCFNLQPLLFCLQDKITHEKNYHSLITIMLNAKISNDDKLNFVKLFVKKCSENKTIIETLYRNQSVIVNLIREVRNISFKILEYLYLSDEAQFIWDYKCEDKNVSLKGSIIDFLDGYIPKDTTVAKFDTFIVKVFAKLTPEELHHLTTTTQIISYAITYCSDILVLGILKADNVNQTINGWSIITLIIQYKPNILPDCLHLFNNLTLENYNGMTAASLAIVRNIDRITPDYVEPFKDTLTYEIFEKTQISKLSGKALCKLVDSLLAAKYLPPSFVKKICKLFNGCYFAQLFELYHELIFVLLPPYATANTEIIYKYMFNKAKEAGINIITFKTKTGNTILHTSLLYKYILQRLSIDEYLEHIDTLVKNGHDIAIRDVQNNDLLDLCTIFLDVNKKTKELVLKLNSKYFNRTEFKVGNDMTLNSYFAPLTSRQVSYVIKNSRTYFENGPI